MTTVPCGHTFDIKIIILDL